RGEGKMAKGWMEAAGQDVIPIAFIVNGDGAIAWIGHPMKMDKSLEEIVNGTWNLKAAAAEYKEKMALLRKRKAIRQEIAKAKDAGNSKEVVAIVDRAIADDPKFESEFAPTKFAALAGRDGDADRALEYGTHLMKDVYKDNADTLIFLARTIVDRDVSKA